MFLMTAAPASAAPPAPDGGPGYEAGEVLVKFKPGLSRSSAAAALPDKSMALGKAVGDRGVYKVQVSAGHELEAAASLRGRADVLYAEPNYRVFALEEPDDSLYSSQWAYPIIQAPLAWDIATGRSSITIAVVDTGVDLTHPDLAGKVVQGYDFIGGDTTPQDENGHGSHVAGIAAAVTNNGLGVAGTSWGAKIMPVRVLDENGGGYVETVAEGVTWAAAHGADIINLSLGSVGNSTTLAEAISAARAEGVLVAAAGGNCGNSNYWRNGCSYQNQTFYPAANNGVVAVAATDSSDSRASYSNQGSYIDVAAPGDSILSTYISNDYQLDSGTSMATPFVCGLAALIWSSHRSMSVDDVEALIESSADDLGSAGRDDAYGWGRINLYRAQTLLFNATDNHGPAESYTIPVINPTGSSISWSASKSAAWLHLSSSSGSVPAYSTIYITVTASRTMADGDYGIYNDTISVTRSLSGGLGQPQTYQTSLFYALTYNLPLVGKHTP